MADETHAVAGRKKPNYYLVWLYLLILTVAEVGVAFMSGLPETWMILLLLFLLSLALAARRASRGCRSWAGTFARRAGRRFRLGCAFGLLDPAKARIGIEVKIALALVDGLDLVVEDFNLTAQRRHLRRERLQPGDEIGKRGLLTLIEPRLQLADTGLALEEVCERGYVPIPYEYRDYARFRTPTGKIELYSTRLEQHGQPLDQPPGEQAVVGERRLSRLGPASSSPNSAACAACAIAQANKQTIDKRRIDRRSLSAGTCWCISQLRFSI